MLKIACDINETAVRTALRGVGEYVSVLPWTGLLEPKPIWPFRVDFGRPSRHRRVALTQVSRGKSGDHRSTQRPSLKASFTCSCHDTGERAAFSVSANDAYEEEGSLGLSGADIPAGRITRRQRRSWLVVMLASAITIGLAALYWIIVTDAGSGTSPQTIQDVSTTFNQVGATGHMKGQLNSLVAIVLIGLPLLVPLIWFAWLYNAIVEKEEGVYGAWAQVQSNYQRRADLIPNLVNSVRRYVQYEHQTFVDVTAEHGDALEPLVEALDQVDEARQQAEQLGETPKPDAEAEARLEELAVAQQAVERNISRLFGVVEAYPQLRSSEQFLELQAQLEGAENRINVARVQFNRSVEDYNASIRKLPGSLIAGLGRFQRKAYFQAAKGATEAVGVGFN